MGRASAAMKCGHLFNGIGGFALAASWMGWENVFHCEIDPYCNEVMRKNCPNSKKYGDIKRTKFGEWRGAVDIISGGDPCQPSSYAGLRKGKEDERYLWKEYRRCVEECRPKYIINENVPGSISNGILDEKIDQVEAIGYTCWPPLIIPASAVGSLHRRDRVWLVAHSNGNGLKQFNMSTISDEQRKGEAFIDSSLFEAEWAQGENKSAILRMADGVSAGLDTRKRIKAVGNSIVPQVAYRIYGAIDFFDRANEK
jgi:DNA (cytosine-5)-methyltransferase 1